MKMMHTKFGRKQNGVGLVTCHLYTFDDADEECSVDPDGCGRIKLKNS